VGPAAAARLRRRRSPTAAVTAAARQSYRRQLLWGRCSSGSSLLLHPLLKGCEACNCCACAGMRPQRLFLPHSLGIAVAPVCADKRFVSYWMDVAHLGETLAADREMN
jgi:hypothetical protein